MFKLPLFGVVCDVKGKDAFLVGLSIDVIKLLYKPLNCP